MKRGSRRRGDNILDKLPEDILAEIFARFPLKTLLQYRCVSKKWSSLIAGPTFVLHHLHKTTTKNNDLVLIKYQREEDGCSLYQDKETYKSNDELCVVEEFDFPFKGSLSYSQTDVVGSCNGVLCLSNVYYDQECGFYCHRVALWNPSIRKVVVLPPPYSIFKSKYDKCFAKDVVFGFGCTNNCNDYKVVQIKYYSQSVEVYSLEKGSWRGASNDPKYLIRKDCSTVFVNGASHWIVNPQHGGSDGGASNVIVVFGMEDEEFGEMAVPDDFVFEDNVDLTISVFHGSLSLVAFSTQRYRTIHCLIWVMKEYGNARSWTRVFNIVHPFTFGIQRFVAFKNYNEIVLATYFGDLIYYNLETKNTKYLFSQSLRYGYARSLYFDTFKESLVLLNEESWVWGDSVSVGGNENKALRLREHFSNVVGLDKKRRKKKRKVME